jgi:hypothetical protein
VEIFPKVVPIDLSARLEHVAAATKPYRDRFIRFVELMPDHQNITATKTEVLGYLMSEAMGYAISNYFAVLCRNIIGIGGGDTTFGPQWLQK